MDNRTNGWSEYKRLVLDRIDESREVQEKLANELQLIRLQVIPKLKDDLSKDINDIRTKDLPKLKDEINNLKIKSGLWGGTSGVIATIVTFIGKALWPGA